MNTQLNANSLRPILIIIAIGIWAIVLQIAGIITTDQNVKVVNSVNMNGRVEVTNPINIGNSIDVNIEAINGHKNAFYDYNNNQEYNRIPVYAGN
jgi:hypothetical protein